MTSRVLPLAREGDSPLALASPQAGLPLVFSS